MSTTQMTDKNSIPQKPTIAYVLSLKSGMKLDRIIAEAAGMPTESCVPHLTHKTYSGLAPSRLFDHLTARVPGWLWKCRETKCKQRRFVVKLGVLDGLTKPIKVYGPHLPVVVGKALYIACASPEMRAECWGEPSHRQPMPYRPEAKHGKG